MKKFVVLMLVLGIASFASAGLTWTDGAGNDVSTITLTSTSDTAVVYISSDVAAGGWFSASIADTSVAEFTAATKLDAMGNTGSASLYLTGGQYNVYGKAMDDDPQVAPNIEVGDWIEVVIHATGAGPGSTTANSFAIGTATIGPGTDLIINHIPEPATIALLGLGGLLLRRKKA